jgi:hypothetical protein
MSIDPAYKLPEDTVAEIVSNGLLGEQYLSLVPGLAIRAPRPTAIRRDRHRHHCAAFDHRLRQQLPPPSEQLVAVHIMTPRHDRHRRPRRQRLCHHLALQRFGILPTLRRARLLLSVHKAGSGHLFCLIRHPLIIASIGAQRQALLTERLRVITG